MSARGVGPGYRGRLPPLTGSELPRIQTPPPGPRSLASAGRLRRSEGAAIWGRGVPPIVWARARGAVVEDLDGNRYLDLTGGFGVASLGHAPAEVRRAVSRQAGRLLQGLGDLQPHVGRERLIRRLSALGGRLDRVLLASTGSEAVELAIKTAAIATGRRRVVAFTGAYHGDSHGALEVTHAPEAPAPIRAQRAGLAIHIPYPDPSRCPLATRCARGACDLRCMADGQSLVDRALEGDDPPGAVLVEPIQGRAGVIVPPAEFLPRLCREARRRRLVVIYDEVLTGAGRTGPFWAWERSGPDAEPDLMAAGKGLGGGVAIAALFGRREVMEAWGAHATPAGEAPHASTFYAHPLACAGALASVARLSEPSFRAGVERRGALLADGLARIGARHARVGSWRSVGLMGALDLVRTGAAGGTARGAAPARETLETLLAALLARGVLALPAGIDGNVLELLPPLTITEEQLERGLSEIDAALEEVGG